MANDLRRADLLLSRSLPFRAELELRYAALERIIADQLFTQDGRHYVRGNRTTRASSRIWKLRISTATTARLRVTARFSGRSAVDLFGGCVGLGDSFDLTMTASPVPHDGAIALRM